MQAQASKTEAQAVQQRLSTAAAQRRADEVKLLHAHNAQAAKQAALHAQRRALEVSARRAPLAHAAALAAGAGSEEPPEHARRRERLAAMGAKYGAHM